MRALYLVVVYLLAPVLFLLFGWTPVSAFNEEFFVRLIPYLLANQLLFLTISWGLKTWRGQQYSIALFPVWIQAVVSAARNVWTGKDLTFLVTPKERRDGVSPSIVWPQLTAIALLSLALVVGVAKLALGLADDAVPVVVNLAWAAYDIAVLSVVFGALAFRPNAAAARDDAMAPADAPRAEPVLAGSYEGFGSGLPGEG